MAVISATDYFNRWLGSIRDPAAKRRIRARIEDAEEGNFGDCVPAGGGVSEMRLHYGFGYRLYLTKTGQDEYTLLAGGTKERQQSDIDMAKDIKRELEKGGSW